MIKVSVLMAEYNTKEEYLLEAIESILNQTFKDFEFIIIDDCGNNNLQEIVSRFNDKRIVVIRNPRNIGLVGSLNNGLRHAKGKYIVRMDTDDIAKPTRIETIYNYIVSHKEFSVVGSLVNEFSSEGISGTLGRPGEKVAKNVMRGDSFIHPTVIMDKHAIASAGGYDAYNRAEDLALWCKLTLKGHRLYVINQVLLDYRVNSDDYKKRKLRHRQGEIKARLYYYPKLGASLFDYLFIAKSILSGILPVGIVRIYRKRFVLQSDNNIETNELTGENHER